MLKVDHLSIRLTSENRFLVSDLSLTAAGGDRLAVIGDEGNGKTTLLKVLAKEKVPGFDWSGDFAYEGEAAYLEQEPKVRWRGLSTLDFLLRKDKERAIDFEDYALLAKVDGLRERLSLSSLAFSLDKKVEEYSGGEMIKVSLLKVLLREPSLLLLDEPTNDLDLTSLAFLTEFLRQEKRPLLFVSHDETLLKDVATGVIELKQLKRKTEARSFFLDVPYATYVATMTKKDEAERRIGEKQRAVYAKKMERFRQIYQRTEYLQANLAKEGSDVQGRLLKKHIHVLKSEKRRLEKSQEDFVELPEKKRVLRLFFEESVVFPPNKRLEIDLPELSVSGRVLAHGVKLRTLGPEKIAIIGDNGVGKSTLLRQIYARLKDRKDLKVGYMPQDYSETLDDEATPYFNLSPTSDKKEQEKLKTLLGNELFTPEEMERPVRFLSGGEKAKLLLTRLVVEGSNVILLDEPTRNLSPSSVREVSGLLQDYRGLIIAVSHDRMFLALTFPRILKLTPEGLLPWD